MTNREIAKLLDMASELLTLQSENPFKIKAYEKGADALRSSEKEMSELIAQNAPIETVGIGKGIAEHIRQILQTGTFPELETLKTQVPPGVVEIAKLPGIGPKKVTQLWKEIGITSLESLAQKCETHALSVIKGFTVKSEQEILHHIKIFQQNKTKQTLYRAEILADRIEQTFLIPNGIFDFHRTGDLRRSMPVVSSWEWVAVSGEEAVNSLVKTVPEANSFSEETENGKIKTVSWKQDGLFAVEIYFVPAEEKYYHLFDTTADGVYTELLKDVSLKVNSEEEIFSQNNLSFIPPELRENKGETGLPPERFADLIQIGDLKGTIHAHSTYSDGVHSLEQMASGCMERGFSYLGITDHSQTAVYASGLKPDRVIKQHAEIDELNKRLAPFKIFKGIESDILKDGSLDYEKEVLASFDFIVASVHGQMNMNEGEATYRIIQAIKNPYTSVLGHSTGRLLLRRDGYPLDSLAVIEACAEHHVAIELNGNPYRMDMDWSLIRFATDKGVKIAVTADAHSKSDLDYHLTGVKVARKGWLRPQDTLNAMTAEELSAWFAEQKRLKLK